jgi:hypothetical protein
MMTAAHGTGIRWLAGLTVPAALTGVLALSGCAAGSTPASARAAAPAADHVHFIDYSVNSDGPGSSVIVTGAIGDYGHGVTVTPDGKVDPGHTSELELRLGHGAFRLQIAALDRAIVAAFQHWPANITTCSGSITVRDTVPVVPGSGTGSYRGLSGSFDTTATIDEVDSARPACQHGTGPFLAQVIIISGTGTVALPQ